MGHFRGTVQGNRGQASRLGTKSHGLNVQANGWDFGVTVVMYHCDTLKRDVAEIYLTHGSNGRGPSKCLGRYSELEFQPQPQT